MTDMLDPPDDGVEGDSRRRAIWGLGVLALAAIILVSLLILLGGHGGGSRGGGNAAPAGPAVTYGSSTHRSSGPTATSTSAGAATTAATAGPTRTGDPCDGEPSCLVPGDGGALAALNAFRAAHDLPPVPGGVSTDAQTCALNQGSGSTCVPHYAWTGVATQDGADAISKIAQFGSAWMLDAGIQRIDVGWAYVKGQYQCVLLKSP